MRSTVKTDEKIKHCSRGPTVADSETDQVSEHSQPLGNTLQFHSLNHQTLQPYKHFHLQYRIRCHFADL